MAVAVAAALALGAEAPAAPPPPVVEGAPAETTTATTARITFSSPVAGASFVCALDARRPAPCRSPWDVARVAEGEHTAHVVAVDREGTRSAPAVVTRTVLPPTQTLGDGAWSWFADPRAVRHDGLRHRTYAGWVARDGDVEVTAYDHVSLTRTTAVLASGLQVDDHANPALQVLPDGRLRVFYSAHGGGEMLHRTSTRPEDVSSWSAPRAMPGNTPGVWGFTYPNPVRLADERRTYLFWRGGDFNPAFATQADGAEAWTPARPVIAVPGERPYLKVHGDGRGTIHLAFTNAHPREADDVDVHYARYRAGALHRADGTRIGALPGPPITPAQADVVADRREDTWVHDVAADAAGRPVVVFASFPPPADHRYHYARWTGRRWVTHEITAAGGSISEDPREPQYSGGLTLDHEDPATVVLSRAVDGVFEVETWRTADGGATWARRPVTAASAAPNVRPVTPRGLDAPTPDLSVLWMHGRYASSIDFRTSITTDLRLGGNRLPVAAAASPAPAAGPAPQTVELARGRHATRTGGSSGGAGTSATGRARRARWSATPTARPGAGPPPSP